MSELRGQILSIPARYVVETCCNCGIAFCMTENFKRRRSQDGEGFYCPNGHRQFYVETEVTRLKKQLEMKDRYLARQREWSDSLRNQRDTAQRSAAAYKANLTRIKNRVQNGVCPCCNRTFANLARHMKTKHPEQNK